MGPVVAVASGEWIINTSSINKVISDAVMKKTKYCNMTEEWIGGREKRDRTLIVREGPTVGMILE